MAGEVVAIPSKTELKCKLCKHPERTEIDNLLLRRSLRQKDEDGNPINMVYVLDALRDLGVDNPTEDNVKNHFKKHVQVVSEKVAVKQRERREIAMSGSGTVDVDALLDKLILAGESDLDTLMEETGKSGVTVDQMLKAAQIKSSRKQDERVNQLLGGAVGALGAAFQQIAAPKGPKLIESEVIDQVEVVEVVEVAS